MLLDRLLVEQDLVAKDWKDVILGLDRPLLVEEEAYSFNSFNIINANFLLNDKLGGFE